MFIRALNVLKIALNFPGRETHFFTLLCLAAHTPIWQQKRSKHRKYHSVPDVSPSVFSLALLHLGTIKFCKKKLLTQYCTMPHVLPIFSAIATVYATPLPPDLKPMGMDSGGRGGNRKDEKGQLGMGVCSAAICFHCYAADIVVSTRRKGSSSFRSWLPAGCVCV